MFALVWFARGGERIFHYLFISALAVGTIVYFAQASDLGWDVVSQANNVHRGNRQVFWAKYILWVVEFPVVIIALGLLSGISWATIFYEIFVSWIWVVSYLVGAFTTTNYKWGFFVFGTFAWMALAIHTLRDGNVGAKRLGVTRDHSSLSGWVNLLWLLYPIAWGLSEGGNRIGVTGHFIFFGILDLLMIPVTAWAFMLLARRWDYNRLNIHFTQYGRVNHAPGTFPEKHTTGAPAHTTADPVVATA
jgi:bacteriorhodopsin